MRFTRKGWVFGRYLVTTLNQAGSAPLLDRGFSFTEDGREFEGRCLLLTPWRRNQHGESEPQLALFVGRLCDRQPGMQQAPETQQVAVSPPASIAEVTLDQAWAVINAHNKAEDAKRVEQARTLIGRYFKLASDTDLSEEKPKEKYVRYALVTDVDRSGAPHALSIQIRIRQGPLYDFSSPFLAPSLSGWTEIGADEFQRLTAILPKAPERVP